MDVDIRAVVEEIDENVSVNSDAPSESTTIILDSWADAPAGIPAHPDDGPRRLQDARGKVVPTLKKT